MGKNTHLPVKRRALRRRAGPQLRQRAERHGVQRDRVLRNNSIVSRCRPIQRGKETERGGEGKGQTTYSESPHGTRDITLQRRAQIPRVQRNSHHILLPIPPRQLVAK